MTSELRACPWCGSFYRGLSHCQRDGQQLEPSDGVVDRYHIVDRIGEGGMGAVYKAEHSLLGNRIVAIKLLHREHVRDRALVQRFFREAKAASSVDNEHLVQVVDFGVTDGGDSFLVMEHVVGRGLRDVLDSDAPLSLERSFSIGVQIAEGLYAAHRQGIVHRDLKPENVLLADEIDGQKEFVKLLDFGIAQLSEYRDARITRAGMIIGTPAYMAPEQASGEPVDQRADIYALGTILYEMLVGRCPFEGSSAKEVLLAQLTRKPVPPRQLRPDIPSSIERVILRALNKEPDQRPKTMMYLAYELRDALARQTGGLPALDDPDIERPPSAELLTAAQSLPQRLRARITTRQALLGGGIVAGMLLGVVVTLAVVGGSARGPAGEVNGARPAADAVVARDASPAVARAAPDAAAPKRHHRPHRKRAARHKHKDPGRRTKRSHKREPAVAARSKTSAERETSVKIVSVPAKARVYDGKQLLGRTPISVTTAHRRTINVFEKGYADRVIHLKEGQSGKVVARLSKQVMSWDVLSLRQLKKIRDSGQISRYTYERRKSELLRRRDAKLVKLKVEYKMGHWTKEQYERQVKAIRDSYR